MRFPRTPLALLSVAVLSVALVAAGEPAKRFPATDFGAKGDCTTLNTKAIQLENVDIHAGSDFTVRNAQGVRFNNVKVNDKVVPSPADTARANAQHTTSRN